MNTWCFWTKRQCWLDNFIIFLNKKYSLSMNRRLTNFANLQGKQIMYRTPDFFWLKYTSHLQKRISHANFFLNGMTLYSKTRHSTDSTKQSSILRLTWAAMEDVQDEFCLYKANTTLLYRQFFCSAQIFVVPEKYSSILNLTILGCSSILDNWPLTNNL